MNKRSGDQKHFRIGCEVNDGDWGKYGSPPSDEYMGGELDGV